LTPTRAWIHDPAVDKARLKEVLRRASKRLAEEYRRRIARGFPSQKDREMWEDQFEGRVNVERAEREGRRAEPSHEPITDAQLHTVLDADASRRRDADRRDAARVPAHLAEAQVSLVERCPVCGKPIVGRAGVRSSDGRVRHRGCAR
jgi:hypothetical protein